MKVASSTSTKTGRAPFSRIASPVAMKVLATVTTSSPGADPVGAQRQDQRVGAVGDAAGVGGAAEGRELLLEQRALLAADELGAVDDARDRRVHLGPDAVELGLKVHHGHGHRAHGSRGRCTPPSGRPPQPRRCVHGRGRDRRPGGRGSRPRGPRGSGSRRGCRPRRPPPLRAISTSSGLSPT